MSNLPPRFSDHLFDDIDGPEEQVRAIFGPFIQELHEFLNELPCLRDLQRFRGTFMKRPPPSSRPAFGSRPTIEVGHWFTFNWGGRNEMQFNIGMFGDPHYYVRVGMGFNFTRGGFGDPKAVDKAFDCFTNVIGQRRTEFQQLVHANSLQVEYVRQIGAPLKYIPSPSMIVQRLPELRKGHKCDWIFIGRLLRQNSDLAILQTQAQLKHVIESVFTNFRPYWDQTLACQKGSVNTVLPLSRAMLSGRSIGLTQLRSQGIVIP